MRYVLFWLLVSLSIPNGLVASEQQFPSRVDRSPAIIGPATEHPVGENAAIYEDYFAQSVRLDDSQD